MANYVYVQQEINIKIGKQSPEEYIGKIRQQCVDRQLVYGGIDNIKMFEENLRINCIPGNINEMNFEHYQEFLTARRKMMALKIKEYYNELK